VAPCGKGIPTCGALHHLFCRHTTKAGPQTTNRGAVVMSEPALRRNPARSTRSRVPRHPDSPVSFALPPVLDDSEEESDSIDTPITRDLALGFEAAAHDRSTRNYVAMHEGESVIVGKEYSPHACETDVIEIDESPSPELLSVQPDIGGACVVPCMVRTYSAFVAWQKKGLEALCYLLVHCPAHPTSMMWMVCASKTM
jgi:hypothetical protein